MRIDYRIGYLDLVAVEVRFANAANIDDFRLSITSVIESDYPRVTWLGDQKTLKFESETGEAIELTPQRLVWWVRLPDSLVGSLGKAKQVLARVVSLIGETTLSSAKVNIWMDYDVTEALEAIEFIRSNFTTLEESLFKTWGQGVIRVQVNVTTVEGEYFHEIGVKPTFKPVKGEPALPDDLGAVVQAQLETRTFDLSVSGIDRLIDAAQVVARDRLPALIRDIQRGR